jgi:hypothetical protein
MAGVMMRGRAEVHVVSRLKSGRGRAERLAERVGIDPRDAVVLEIRPTGLVWWRGWSSGTVAA